MSILISGFIFEISQPSMAWEDAAVNENKNGLQPPTIAQRLLEILKTKGKQNCPIKHNPACP